MTRALVTGGAGFIGSHLVDRLIADGWTVTIVDDLRTGDHVNPEATLIAKSVADAEGTLDRYLAAPDVIFHLAGPVGPVGVLGRAGRIVGEIVADATTVARWADGVPLVYVSTSELYGPQEGACSEELPRVTPAGHSARMEYAVAKLAAETMLLNLDLDVRIVRPFNVAGPRQKPDGGFVLPRFVQQALTGQPLTVYQPGTQLRAFTHVADIVDGLMAALERGQAGKVYNLGNPDNLCTIDALAGEVIAEVGTGTIELVDPVELWGPGFREAADKWPDAGKARRELGWEPKHGRRRIIRDVVAAMRGGETYAGDPRLVWA